jgi:1,6-anhydro-N-acetylmuramate kinase
VTIYEEQPSDRIGIDAGTAQMRLRLDTQPSNEANALIEHGVRSGTQVDVLTNTRVTDIRADGDGLPSVSRRAADGA